MPTDDSSKPAIPADSRPSNAMNEVDAVDRGLLRDAPRPICAIHQPNFLPRLSTLAKIYAADVWVVLNDVQFVRRDYQHRARLASLSDPNDQHWLTLPVHLPHGQGTLIKDVVIADADATRRRVEKTLQHAYGKSSHWPGVRQALDPAMSLIATGSHLHDVTEAATKALLNLVGWQGSIMHSDDYTIRVERSARLVDLTRATGSNTYLCGTGGARYIDETPFADAGLAVMYCHPPHDETTGIGAQRLSAVQIFSGHSTGAIQSLLSRALGRASSCR